MNPPLLVAVCCLCRICSHLRRQFHARHCRRGWRSWVSVQKVISPDAANRRKKLRVAFGSTSSDGATANIQLDEDDSNALIRALAKVGVDVGALRESTGGKG